MSDIVYDRHWSSALQILAESERLIPHDKSFNDSKDIKLKTKWKEWSESISKKIFQDIVTYDLIVIPQEKNFFTEGEEDLLAVIDKYDIPPAIINDPNEFKESFSKDFLKYAIQLKPFFIDHVLYNMAKRDEDGTLKGSLWDPATRVVGGNVVQNACDIYDWFFMSQVHDPNSALECIRNRELRMFFIDWVLPHLYYDESDLGTFEGLPIHIYTSYSSDTFFEECFAKLLNLVWEPCFIVNYTSEYDLSMRQVAIQYPLITSKDVPSLISETHPKDILKISKREEAFHILKSNIEEHVKISPSPNSIREALLMRQKKSWKRFRENLNRYYHLLRGGIVEKKVAEEIVKDIKLAQRDLKISESYKKCSMLLAFISVSTATLELLLSVPSLASLALSIFSMSCHFKAESMLEFSSWISLGDLSKDSPSIKGTVK